MLSPAQALEFLGLSRYCANAAETARGEDEKDPCQSTEISKRRTSDLSRLIGKMQAISRTVTSVLFLANV